ncbi:MAG: orotidine 5'-phosphate decarboxylase / HUMPS family protein, partial [Bryobacteraceae bacterium]
MKKIQAQERLIVALDLEDVDAAEKMVKELDGAVTFFKIGLVLQLARGVDGLIRELIGSGKQVFLDYKYYDVEETLRKAVSRASNIGVSFLTIHGSSGLMKAAVRGKGSSSLKLLTVTVLTSMDAADIAEMGYTKHSPEELVLFRARKALEAG